jgi:hypothetical protein
MGVYSPGVDTESLSHMGEGGEKKEALDAERNGSEERPGTEGIKTRDNVGNPSPTPDIARSCKHCSFKCATVRNCRYLNKIKAYGSPNPKELEKPQVILLWPCWLTSSGRTCLATATLCPGTPSDLQFPVECTTWILIDELHAACAATARNCSQEN